MSYNFNFGLPSLYRTFSPALRAKLDALGVDKHYRDGQLMQSRGDLTRGFSIIKSGAVCFGKMDADGKLITTAVYEAGQCYGEFTLFADLPRTHDGYAKGDVTVRHISKPKFDSLMMAEPTLAQPILKSLTMQLHSVLEWADDIRRHPLKYRLGKNLLQMAQMGSEPMIRATQSDLADLMGVTRVAVAGVLRDYKKRGFVTTSYGGLTLCDPDGFKLWLEHFNQLAPV